MMLFENKSFKNQAIQKFKKWLNFNTKCLNLLCLITEKSILFSFLFPLEKDIDLESNYKYFIKQIEDFNLFQKNINMKLALVEKYSNSQNYKIMINILDFLENNIKPNLKIKIKKLWLQYQKWLNNEEIYRAISTQNYFEKFEKSLNHTSQQINDYLNIYKLKAGDKFRKKINLIEGINYLKLRVKQSQLAFNNQKILEAISIDQKNIRIYSRFFRVFLNKALKKEEMENQFKKLEKNRKILTDGLLEIEEFTSSYNPKNICVLNKNLSKLINKFYKCLLQIETEQAYLVYKYQNRIYKKTIVSSIVNLDELNSVLKFIREKKADGTAL